MASRTRSGGIYWDTSELEHGFAKFKPTLDQAVATLMKYEEQKVQSYMRINAPWTDQTTNARNGLFARAFSEGSSHVIVCHHTMPYGIWLEVRFGGAYAIINPTIQAEGRRILGDLRNLLNKMRAAS